jgi:acetyltransferase-like isoleucine patch superfamily enzyme
LLADRCWRTVWSGSKKDDEMADQVTPTQPWSPLAGERVTAVMLLGGLRRSQLETAVGCRPSCLLLDAETSLFAAWTGLLSRVGCSELRVVTSGIAGDDDLVNEATACRIRYPGMSIARSVEASSHRGTGGLLRDAVVDLGIRDWILFIEPHCVPPTTLTPLVEARSRGPMAVGVASGDAPAGAYIMRAELLEHAPRIGYHDFKEQFIALQVTRGIRIEPVRLAAPGIRVHDLRAYLAGVRWWGEHGGPRVHPDADVHATARVSGDSIVAADAHVGAGAIVHDSVILSNAAIGERAIVARSVVPRGLRVAPRSLAVDRIVDEETSDAADEIVALGAAPALDAGRKAGVA